jgi:hypothetical protein
MRLEAEGADVVVQGPHDAGCLYALDGAPGPGFDIDEDAIARAHERWQRDGAYNTIESVNL